MSGGAERKYEGDLGNYQVLGPIAYRGKKGCQDWTCTRGPGMGDYCYGWHCSYCDAPCGMMGHRCDAADAVLGEARRIADEDSP